MDLWFDWRLNCAFARRRSIPQLMVMSWLTQTCATQTNVRSYSNKACNTRAARTLHCAGAEAGLERASIAHRLFNASAQPPRPCSLRRRRPLGERSRVSAAQKPHCTFARSYLRSLNYWTRLAMWRTSLTPQTSRVRRGPRAPKIASVFITILPVQYSV